MYKKGWIAPLFIVVASMILGVAIYPSLPAEIPAHWNLNGEVDNYLPTLTGVIVIPTVMLFIFILFECVFMLSPQSFSIGSSKEKARIIQTAVLLFMLVIYSAQLAMGLGVDINIEQLVIVSLGLLFIIIGNYSGKFPKNTFIGVRTPWTLADDRVWLKTHRVSAWVFVVLGLVFIPAAFLGAPLFLAIGSLVLVALFLVFYSFWVYRALGTSE